MHTPEEIAQSISDGHAFDFHVLGTPREISNGQLSANSNQFDHDTEKYGSRLGITTREQFRNHIFETLHDPNTIGYPQLIQSNL